MTIIFTLRAEKTSIAHLNHIAKEPAYFIDRFSHEGKAIVVSRSGASAGFVSYWNEPIFITDAY